MAQSHLPQVHTLGLWTVAVSTSNLLEGSYTLIKGLATRSYFYTT